MSEDDPPLKRNDFVSHNFIEKGQHNRDVNSIKKRLSDLESLVGDKDKFIATFTESCESSIKVTDAIDGIIDKHDIHKLRVNVTTFLKWLGVLVIGGAIGAFIDSQFK